MYISYILYSMFDLQFFLCRVEEHSSKEEGTKETEEAKETEQTEEKQEEEEKVEFVPKEKEKEEKTEEKKPKRPSLMKVLFLMFWKQFLVAAIFKLIQDLIQFVQPTVLG